MDLLSGDQNGLLALSVPASRRELGSSRARSQSAVFPSTEAVKATARPSGDIAKQLLFGTNSKRPPGGGAMSRRRAAVSDGGRRKYITQPAARAAIRAAAAILQPRSDFRRVRPGVGGGCSMAHVSAAL